MNNFSERLRELRLEKNLTQRDLAKATNLSQTSIAYWEMNARMPNSHAIIILAKFFDVSTDFLLGVKDD